MTALDTLMAMLNDYVKWPLVWSTVSTGSLMFRALREAVQQDGAVKELAQAFNRFLKDPKIRHPSSQTIEVTRTLLLCAQIAALRGDRVARLPHFLRFIDKTAAVPTGIECHTASLEDQNWLLWVRYWLYKLKWPGPLCSAWAWGVVSSLSGHALPRRHSVSLSCLLIVNKEGVIGELTLEALRDAGEGTFYPDPETMWHVMRVDKEFGESLINALEAAKHLLGISPSGDSIPDIRWKIVRRDGKSLHGIEGGSAGAAFALGLAKLLASETVHNGECKPDIVSVLDDIELDEIAATGGVERSGVFDRVESAYEKLHSARDSTVVKIHTAIIAAAQKCDIVGASDQKILTPNPEFYVICAKDLPQAVEKLHEEYGPRAAIRRYELSQCEKLEMIGVSSPVPIVDHYKVPPFLREIKREKLPRKFLPGDKDGKQEEELLSGLRLKDIPGWEQAMLQQAEVTYERVALELVFRNFQSIAKEARSRVPRFVAIGPPGSGKTTLHQYIAWQAASAELKILGRHLIPVRIRLRDWKRWATPKVHTLPSYLTEYYGTKGIVGTLPTADQWERWLQRGDVLLLLDGVDELAGEDRSFMDTLKNSIDTYKECPLILTCRTVSYEQHRSLFPDLPVFTVSGLDDTQRDSFIVSYPERRFDASALIDKLNRTYRMRPLASNPLLLSLICFTVNDAEAMSLPASRSELYNRSVDKLLSPEVMRVPVKYPGTEVPVRIKRRILEFAVLSHFVSMEAQRKFIFREREIIDALVAAADQEGYHADPAPIATALLTDLRDNSGIIRGTPEHGYIMSHLNIQEYLISCALSRIVNKRGWQAHIQLGGLKCTVQHLLDRKCWDPYWAEVVVFFVGQLANPTPVLTILSDGKRDDFFRHRLTLAALCLTELPASTRKLYAVEVARIISGCFSFWWTKKSKVSDGALSVLRNALPALAQADETALKYLIGFSRAWSKHKREAAIDAFATMGAAASTDEVLTRLIESMADEDFWVRKAAIDALGAMGPAASKPAVLKRLLQHLCDRHEYIDGRGAAAKALGMMGPAAAASPILAGLLQVLHDGSVDMSVRRAAAKALGMMGHAAATREVLEGLFQLLHGGMGTQVEHTAGNISNRLNWAAAGGQVTDLDAPTGMLRDTEWSVRMAAAGALLNVDPSETMREALEGYVKDLLVESMRRADSMDLVATLDSLNTLASATITQEVLMELTKRVRRGLEKAANSLGKMPPLDWQKTVNALGMMGPAAAVSEILELMVALLHHHSSSMVCAAVKALGMMGPAAAKPEVLEGLIQILRRDGWENVAVRRAAANTLGMMGPATESDKVIDVLMKSLTDSEWTVRVAAGAALVNLNSAAATHKVKKLLIQSLGSDWFWRDDAAKAVEVLVNQGVRNLRSTWKGLYWKDVETLSKV